MNPFKIWLLACRPKTLFASISPVIIGTAMAYADNGLHLQSAVAALAGAILIQIETNLANDYFDYKKGTDTEERIGPVRVMQAGLATPKQMEWAILIVLGAIIAISAYLFQRGGWPVVAIAVTSILSAIFYTAGPRPLGYVGLGDIFVFVFFGLVAVGGTYYVQVLDITWTVIVAGIAPGLLSVAVLTVNNLRDLPMDRKAGKKTLAVRFGRSFAVSEYLIAVVGAFLVPLALSIMTEDYRYSLLPVLLIFLAIPMMKTVASRTDGPSLNQALANTGLLLFAYSVVFSMGWIW